MYQDSENSNIQVFFCTNTLKNTEINPMAEMHPGILLEVFPKTQPINVPQMTRRSPIQI